MRLRCRIFLQAMANEVHVHLDLSPIDKLLKRLSGSQLKPLLTQWIVRYSAFVRSWFVKNSRGGGEWPDLAESTKKHRAHKKAARVQARREGNKVTTRGAEATRVFAILRDTGVMFNGLSIGGSGNLTEYSKFAVKFGLAAVKHPGSNATIQQIVAYHNEGGKRLPKRVVLREPDRVVIDFMLNTTRRHVGG